MKQKYNDMVTLSNIVGTKHRRPTIDFHDTILIGRAPPKKNKKIINAGLSFVDKTSDGKRVIAGLHYKKDVRHTTVTGGEFVFLPPRQYSIVCKLVRKMVRNENNFRIESDGKIIKWKKIT